MLTLLFALACAPTAETATTAEDWCQVSVAEMAECEDIDWGVPSDRAGQIDYCEAHIGDSGDLAFWTCMSENACSDYQSCGFTDP